MSRYVGANNAKRITRNQGGGDKKQGLAPCATHYFIDNTTGQEYFTESGDGRQRFTLACVNQLGGIGRGRTQFRNNADGKRGCEEKDLTLQYISEITLFIQNQIYSYLQKSGNEQEKLYNIANRFELCYVGESEKFWTDICINSPSIYTSINQEAIAANSDLSNIFTHFQPIPLNGNKFQYVLINSSNGISHSTPLNITLDIPTRNKINYVNEKILQQNPSLSVYDSIFGQHTLGLLNNNFQFGTTSITQWDMSYSPQKFLIDAGYGVEKLNGLHIYYNIISLIKTTRLGN